MSALLQLEQIRREYKRAGQRFAAVDRVDMAMNQGDFVCIVGRSGSGKTTLAGMVAGLITPTAGRIVLCGQELDTCTDDELSAMRNTSIGYIPQGGSLLPYLTALDNVRLPYFLHSRKGPDTSRARAMQLLERAGIGHLAAAYPPTMSGGESRRVALARALMNEPLLLVADEPTSDLDSETTQGIALFMQELNREGLSLLVVTHDAEIAAAAKSLYTMVSGNITPGGKA